MAKFRFTEILTNFSLGGKFFVPYKKQRAVLKVQLSDTALMMTIDDETFKLKEVEIKNEKLRLEQTMSSPESKFQRLLREAEKLFNFAEKSTQSFEIGSPEQCKRIFCDLGSDRTLKDKILTVSIEKPLIVMREASKEARRIHASLEPRKNEVTQEQLEHLYSQSPLMQGQ